MVLPYYASKKSLAVPIADVLLKLAHQRKLHRYSEPFAGMFHVGAALLHRDARKTLRHITPSDTSRDVIIFWQSVLNGWKPKIEVLTT